MLRLLLWALAAASSVSAAERKSRFTYYPMKTKLSLPCDTFWGPDGAVYVEELTGNRIARIDPDSGHLTEYDIPFTFPRLNVTLPGPDRAAFSCAFASGYDGMMYLSNGLRNQLVQMDVHTKVVRVFTPKNPLGNLQPLNDMTAAPDGIYFTSTTGNVVNRFDYNTHEFEVIPYPVPASDPVGIYYLESNGLVYICGFASNTIGILNRKTKAIKILKLPLSLSAPIVMRAELKKRYLYFAATVGNAIGELDTKTNKFRTFSVPTPLSTPVEVCESAAGDVWFTHILQNSIGRLNVTTGEIKEVTLPGTLNPGVPISFPQYVGSGIICRPKRSIWGTEATLNRAYRYQLY